ncbi:MAG: hypothetical protein ABIM99_04460 [Candidatus Dojkabacteria bacterium]
MHKKNSYTLIYIIIAAIAIFSIALIGFNVLNGKNIINVSQTNSDFPLDLDILGKLNLSYSDMWAITNNGTQGIELTKADVTVLLTTSQIEDNKTLDEIVDGRKDSLKATKKILSDTKLTINSIEFRRIEYGSLDETLFPSDGLISYSAIVNNNIFLTMVVNFPSGGNPTEAESLVKTIRYN